MLVHHALPERGVDEQVAGRVGAVGASVLDAAGRHGHPQDVVVGDGLLDRPAVECRLEEDPESPSGPEGERVLQGGRHPLLAVLHGVVLARVELSGVVPGVLGAVQLPQLDPAQQAVLRRPADQGVLRSLDRAEEYGPRLQPAEEVPLPLLRGVDGEHVERTADDEPQHLRPLQRHTAQPRAVDGVAEAAESVGDRVAAAGAGDGRRVDGRHVSAP